MGRFDDLRDENGEPLVAPRHGDTGMVSLVVLSNIYVELTEDALRTRLDRVFPGRFLPPRDDHSFVVDNDADGAQFMIKSLVAGAAGLFMLNSVPGPYALFSDFLDHIADPALHAVAEAQECWLSVDLINSWTSEDEAWRFIGYALAELAPADAAALVHPGRSTTIAFNGDVRRALANGERVL